MVLFFGEIIPQALCSKWGLAIGAKLSLLVKFLMLIFFPVAYPIGKLLDRMLGEDHRNYFQRKELHALVSIHGEEGRGPLSIDETTIIKGALEMKTKTVKQCMTPLDKVFMFSVDKILNASTMKEIKAEAHSRIPVYKGKRSNVLGLLLVKSLLFVNLEDTPSIEQVELRELPNVEGNKDLYEMLNLFQTGRSHMAGVIDESTKETIGIVTLEDIIEELIQEEILDEDDLADQYMTQAKKALQQARKFNKGLSFIPKKRRKDLESLLLTIQMMW